MAGDWIKIEITTPDKPEVIAIASALRMDQDAVVGKLVRLWGWADLNSIDGNSLSITEAFIDRISQKKGFAQALRKVGWLEGKDGEISFPDFSRHNGKTAKQRGETNRRVSKHRAKGNASTVTNETPPSLVNTFQKPLPEKEKEYLEREREGTSSRLFQIVTTAGEESDRVQDLRALTNSLRPGWQASPVFSPDEEAAFQSNLESLKALAPETWEIMRDYIVAKLPEGTGEWQPRQRIMFLRRPGGLAAPAVSWHHKRPSPAKKTQKPALDLTPSEDDATEEDIAALFRPIKTASL